MFFIDIFTFHPPYFNYILHKYITCLQILDLNQNTFKGKRVKK